MKWFYPHEILKRHNLNSRPTVTLCTFTDNDCGIDNVMSSPTVTHCAFTDNYCGIKNEKGYLTVTHCDFTNTGRGIDGNGSHVTVTHCTFTENSYCGMEIWEGSMHVSYCTFLDNTELHGYGGGIDYVGNNGTVTNCIFARNYAAEGAAVSGADVTNCTFYENLGAYGHGALAWCGKVTNCILWKNGEDPNGAISITYCCIDGGAPGIGNIDLDPLFVDPANDDYHLTGLSPCINRGTNAEALADDLDGDPRPNMGTVDMGADEFTGTHTLSAYSYALSQSAGGVIPFFLQAGAPHAGQWYCLFSSLSGTSPGLPLPGDQATLPINPDVFTYFALERLNTPYFFNFLSVLNGGGMGSAILDIPAGALPLGGIGHKMHFAYTIDSLDMASNPVEVMITP